MNYSFFDFYQLNYFLIVIRHLTKGKKSVSKNILINECSSHLLAGRRYNYEKAFNLALLLNLISEKNEKICLSKIGKLFLLCNPNSYYELNDKKKEFIINNYIFRGLFSLELKELFLLFLPDYENETYYFNLDEDVIPREKEPILALFLNLGLIDKCNSLLIINKLFVKQISELLSPEIKILSKELIEKIKYQKKLGDHAENLVYKFEKERLKKMNNLIQANLVRKISYLNPSAGYDIESFNGDKISVEFNRFIEVKACSEDKMRFYWTRNEYNTASKLKNNYWIYLIKNLHLADKGPISPIMFRDPISIFEEKDKYIIEPYVFLIEKD